MSNLTTSKAAAEVLELVNSRPNTPRPEEIETILSHHLHDRLPMTLRVWDQTLAECRRSWDAIGTLECSEERERRYEATDQNLIDFCQRTWEQPVQDWGHVAVRAAIAKHWVWPNFDPLLSSDFSELLSRAKVKERCAMDQQSVAHLLEGIATLLGRPLELSYEPETGGPRRPAQEAARHG